MDAKQTFEDLTHRLQQFFKDAHSTQALVALSGGIDSALVVALAVEALGADQVRVVLLPSPFSSSHSVDDSVAMASKLNLHYDIVAIDDLYEVAMCKLRAILPASDLGLASENIQSRLRCALTMGVSNATGALMLNTSNRSEILVGYGTLYGDTSGAVGVIASLYKGEVYELSRYINSVRGEVIPQNIIDKAPSAELRDGQLDSESLPDYEILDAILRRLVDQGQSPETIARDYPAATVERVVMLNRASAFKRLQLPPAL
ncbi:MAG: NAD(+) synthase [Mucinivorans sp.]